MREQEIEVRLREYEQAMTQITRQYEETQRSSQMMVQQLRESETRIQTLSGEV